MIKKILILATVAFSILIGGCDQVPPSDNPPEKPAVNQPENSPESQPVEKPETKTATPPQETKPPVQQTETTNSEPPKVVKPTAQPQKISVKVYYPDDAGINLVAVNRNIEVKNSAEKYLAAVKLLMMKPTEDDLTVIFPKNAKINGVKVENGTAYVDFGKNITKGFVGGSTGEELLVNSIVKTLTEFKEVKQVRFLVDGAEIETLSGHMDLSEPIKRADL